MQRRGTWYHSNIRLIYPPEGGQAIPKERGEREIYQAEKRACVTGKRAKNFSAWMTVPCGKDSRLLRTITSELQTIPILGNLKCHYVPV